MKRAFLVLLSTLILCVFCEQKKDCEDENCDKSRSKREVVGAPQLELYPSFKDIPMPLYSGGSLKFHFSVNHTSASSNDAHCVHIRISIPRFLKFKAITSNHGILPTVQEEADDLSFKYPYVLWIFKSVAVTFEMTFDPRKTLKLGHHYLTVPVLMHYYDEWEETPEGETIKEGNKIITPMTTTTTTFQYGDCYLPLGINSGEIKAYMISASSNYPDSQPSQARMDDDGWCALIIDENQYIQVDFEYLSRVTKVEIKARRTKTFWVESFFLQFSRDGDEWIDYYENGKKKIFPGNENKDNSVSHWLVYSIEAYSIRLRPVTWREMICLRIELYGCKIDGSLKRCLSALGMESGYIPNEALKSKAENTTAPGNPSQGRLNQNVPEYPFGWMALQGYIDYYQIDFGGIRKVTRVVTQGGWTSEAFSPYFVKKFLIEYSNNTNDLVYYKENGRTKLIPGPKNGYEAKYQVTYTLKTPIIARYIRIIPMVGNSAKVMRIEVIGCLLEDMPPYQGSKDFSRRSVLTTPHGIFFVCMYTSSKQDSSCFQTTDGSTWKSLKHFVVNVLGYDTTTGVMHALDRNYNYRKSTDGGETWISVLRSEWERNKLTGNVILPYNIPENLVSDTPTDSFTFSTQAGITWGVSASGVHMMTSNVGTWHLIGQWKCCGL